MIFIAWKMKKILMIDETKMDKEVIRQKSIKKRRIQDRNNYIINNQYNAYNELIL